MSPSDYRAAVEEEVGKGALLTQCLALYPPASGASGASGMSGTGGTGGTGGVASIENVHSLGRIEADQMHCSLRRRATLFANAFSKKDKQDKRDKQDTQDTQQRSVTQRSFTYRFDYWYQSNANCSAVPNYHLPYMGAVHQDEVTFVMGQVRRSVYYVYYIIMVNMICLWFMK